MGRERGASHLAARSLSLSPSSPLPLSLSLSLYLSLYLSIYLLARTLPRNVCVRAPVQLSLALARPAHPSRNALHSGCKGLIHFRTLV